MNDILKSVITRRLERRLEHFPFKALDVDGFFIAGNSLNQNTPNDFDLYPWPHRMLRFKDEVEITSSTLNADTAVVDGVTIQICRYQHDSLIELVNSFDFAHIMVGASVRYNFDDWKIMEVYHADEYEEALLTQDTFFTGSEYPLSSLIREFKYHARGDFAGNSYLFSAIKIVTAVVERGFKDYEDFKDQLDAVDLGLVTDDMDDEGAEIFTDLFELLRKDNKFRDD